MILGPYCSTNCLQVLANEPNAGHSLVSSVLMICDSVWLFKTSCSTWPTNSLQVKQLAAGLGAFRGGFGHWPISSQIFSGLAPFKIYWMIIGPNCSTSCLQAGASVPSAGHSLVSNVLIICASVWLFATRFSTWPTNSLQVKQLAACFGAVWTVAFRGGFGHWPISSQIFSGLAPFKIFWMIIGPYCSTSCLQAGASVPSAGQILVSRAVIICVSVWLFKTSCSTWPTNSLQVKQLAAGLGAEIDLLELTNCLHKPSCLHTVCGFNSLTNAVMIAGPSISIKLLHCCCNCPPTRPQMLVFKKLKIEASVAFCCKRFWASPITDSQIWHPWDWPWIKAMFDKNKIEINTLNMLNK